MFRLAELDATEVEVVVEDAAALDCEVVLVMEVLGVVVALVMLVALVVEDLDPLGTENPTTPPMIMTTMMTIANAVVLRP